jgi:ubiquinone biosynthesis monooxygenase Coq7
MACTDAVEEEINQHYQKQLDTLAACADELPAQLIETIKICHADELAHQATAINHGSHQAPYYPLMTKVIRKITRAAIALSKRI